MGLGSLIVFAVLLIVSAGAAVWLVINGMYWMAAAAVAAVLFLVYRLVVLYTGNVRKLNYLLSAFEN